MPLGCTITGGSSGGGLIPHASSHEIGGSDVLTGVTGDIQALEQTNYIIIKSLSDFPTPVGGVITLQTSFIYKISGTVNIGNNSINFNGADALLGDTSSHDAIVSTTTNALLTAGASNQIRIRTLGLQSPNGPLLDFNGSGSFTENIIFLQCEPNGFTSLGIINDCFLIGFTDCLFSNFADGFTFGGSNGLCRFQGGTYESADLGNSLIDLASATFLSFTVTAALSIAVDTGAFFLSGLAGNGNVLAGSGAVAANIFSGAGTGLVGITCNDTKWDFAANSPFSNICQSVESVNIYIAEGDELATVISIGDGDVSNPKKVNGAFTTANAQRFTTNAAGTMTYIGLAPVTAGFAASFQLDPDNGNNRSYNLYVAINGVINIPSKSRVAADAGNPQSVEVIAELIILTGDTIDLYMENRLDLTDATILGCNIICKS